MFFNFITYNKFKLKKWRRLSFDERAVVCQKLEKIQAKKQRRPVYKIVVQDLKAGVAGTCVSEKRQILLDIVYLTDESKRFRCMSVLFHEGRHAYQFDEINEKKRHCIFSKAYWWKKNFEGYVNIAESGDTISFYTMQPVEQDADSYALKRLRSFRFRYRKEKDYLDTLAVAETEYGRDVARAKKELGIFYRIKVALRNKKESKKNKRNK